MFNHQIPHQYLSTGTEDPTVTLGNQYSPHRISEVHNRRKQNAEELPQNVKLQYEKEIHIYQSQIETLKDQLQLDEKEKQAYEEMILKLKKERSAVSSENMKLSQENEKHRILIEKLKIDNSSMEMEINRFRSERKVYYNNLNNIDSLKNDLTHQMADKNKTIDQLSSQLRRIQKNHFQCRSKLEQYEGMLKDSETEKEELREELRSTLEKYLSHGNILSKLEYQLKEVNELNKNLKDKIYDLQDERKQLMLKLGYDLSSNSKENQLSESNRSVLNTNPRSMLQIQSYMKEIGNLLDLKRENNDQRFKGYDKLKHAIGNLQINL